MSAPTRCCGTRVLGGAYAVCDLGGGGKPVEWFVVDSPVPVDERFPIRKRGVSSIVDGDTVHVLDWIGEGHYPNVADFIEETRAFGMSRRIPKNFDFQLLNEKSKMVLVHRRGFILNANEYPECMCPKERLPAGDIGLVSMDGRVYHAPPEQTEAHDLDDETMCAGLYYRDLTGEDAKPGEVFERELPSLSYSGIARPADIVPVYVPAVFMMLPITRIVIVDDPNRKAETARLRDDIASRTWLNVTLEDA